MKIKHTIFVLFLSIFCLNVSAQKKDVTLPPNWYNLDLVNDGYFGVSTEKAYQELLKGKSPKKKVVVAVIDGGTETGHEDLKDVIWTNTKEIPNNGIDDDKNGYIDDVHGWNFIGSKNGNLTYDNLELVRIYRKYDPKYRSTIRSTPLDSTEKEEYDLYRRVTSEFGKRYDDADKNFSVLTLINNFLDSVAVANGKETPTLADIENYKTDDSRDVQIKKIIRKGAKESGGFDKFYKEIKDAYRQYNVMLKYNLNPKYDQRAELVGDDYDNPRERIYGNNDVMGPNAEHGTHVSGIIAANRNNDKGIRGVADNVLIMPIRVVPEGDERDKDVANGIRYAVDNGADIINMSFGKGYKWDKEVVDEAIKYAESKGVLLVHAAGNDNKNNDRVANYPTKYYDSKEEQEYRKKNKTNTDILPRPVPMGSNPNAYNAPRAPAPLPVDTAKFNLPHANNWIEVGASAYADDADLKAGFSNYGKYTVDVFAPGFMIKSTVPKSQYEEFDGTSMAAPVVSGVAAVLLSYYPDLTPQEIRDIIIKSVTKVNRKVKYKNDRGETVKVNFSDLCKSGGVVNLYNALKLAETYKK
ncbi:S8 family serine peptidase [Pedobacter sp.]|uniref:S8 family serine peptidase n=1 Tax=Pedobacter sp. TaxID=1411316 RepID=UPI003D7F94BB